MKFFSLIYQGDVHPSNGEKRIPADTFTQLLEAEQIIEKAREDADRLHKETLQECEKLKQEADRRGYEAGLEKLNSAILSFDQLQKTLRHELQQLVIPLALTAAKKIVGRELQLAPDAIVDIVIQALAPVTGSHKVVIYVSKHDKERLEAERPKILNLLAQVQTLAIQEKADLKPGDCMIKTEKGLINATLDNQWAALERAFEKFSQKKPSA